MLLLEVLARAKLLLNGNMFNYKVHWNGKCLDENIIELMKRWKGFSYAISYEKICYVIRPYEPYT